MLSIEEKQKYLLFNIGELYDGLVIKRPSLHCKTPYVADILLTENNLLTLGHSASLGCGGLSNKDSCVYVQQLETKKKCSHKIMLSKKNNIYVGIYPKLSENMVEIALKNSCKSLYLLKKF